MAETLYFSSYGNNKQSSTPLVLLHGWGLNSAVWQPFINSLAENFTDDFQVITVDLPGFGLNRDNTIEPYSLANIVTQLNHTISQPAIYLGWSLGGLVATEMALTHPEKVLALVSVASSPCFIEKSPCSQEVNSHWPGIKPHILHNFHQQLKEDTQKTITNFLKIQAMGSPHIRQDIKQITHLVMQHDMPSKATLDQSLALLETSDHRKQLTLIHQPFLRLYGSNDSLVPKRAIEQIAKLANQSEQHVFSPASHAPFISHLDEFNQVVTAWLLEHFSN
ncbi:MAG: pimeloyl-ACP methyl ester esterase BioH [Litorilituus sp.]|nr:pimeloyl-ACP methyl ester esterase BioH [Litorilituus sp.]